MIAVRPQVSTEVLSDLEFRSAHHVISLMAIIPLEKVAALVAPAGTVTRAIPLPLAAERRGPTVIYPPDPIAAEMCDRLGTTIVATSPEQFSAFSAATATMAPYFAFVGEITSWLSHPGVPADNAALMWRPSSRGSPTSP